MFFLLIFILFQPFTGQKQNCVYFGSIRLFGLLIFCRFATQIPIAMIHLDKNDLPALTRYLRERSWIPAHESVLRAEKPGEGNMNYTLRIETASQTFILKQSRAYVEKFPQIPAPIDRVLNEGKFYQLAASYSDLQKYLPHILGIDKENNCITAEDLGNAGDYTWIYKKGNTIEGPHLKSAIEFISSLHSLLTIQTTAARIPNRELRALNAEHIFDFPFRVENGFDLDTVQPGLQALAMKYKQDEELKKKVKALSAFYTEDGAVLLHGDYYPGSWLKTSLGFKVIDPEFCFFGRPEFDVSVMLAHFYMAQQSANHVRAILELYQAPEGFDHILLEQLCGVEIMRRLIGLAQLPLDLTLEEKADLLEIAYGQIML